MFKITYKHLGSMDFKQGMQFLSQQMLPGKVSYEIKKLTDKLNSAERVMREQFQKEIMEVFGKRNEDGSLAFVKDSNGKEDKNQLPLDETKIEDFKKAKEEFDLREAQIDRSKLFVESITHIDIPAAVLGALDPILTEMTIVMGGKADQEDAAS